jgi:hypothetical protein
MASMGCWKHQLLIFVKKTNSLLGDVQCKQICRKDGVEGYPFHFLWLPITNFIVWSIQLHILLWLSLVAHVLKDIVASLRVVNMPRIVPLSMV